jgi:asparagine synthase (glutamine-hydrolysing)
MCGIAGYVDFHRAASATPLQAMISALARRGPDASGSLVEGACGLAHTRLSIIDPTGSPQPMAEPEAGLSLVYNGETYNYMALRRELQSLGESFRTQGDTEVFLKWLARSWTHALPKFDAMFAVAAWDARKERLLLARDPLGEKPLFFATPRPGLLAFGSEIKAVLTHPAVDRSLNQDALRQALRFRAVYGSETLHTGVRQLEPGCWLEFSRKGLVIGRFHDLIEEAARARQGRAGFGASELVAKGKLLFLESVEERLVADVPVGAFLSGGLDSSLITAAIRKVRGPDAELRTFSVGFTGDPHSELPFAKQVADHLGTHHQTVEVDAECYIRRMAELSGCRDAPVSQPADIAMAELSRVAKEHVKVALSGEGADEAFAGYPKYAFARAPEIVRHAIRAIGPARLSAVAGRLGVDRRRTLVAACALAERREVDQHVQWFSYFDRSRLQSLLPGLSWSESEWDRTMASVSEALSRLEDVSELARMQTGDCLTWLPGNMLERGDRMSMAEGLEVRVPFLDPALCAFGLALPDELKVKGLTGKLIVRQWAAELIPPAILKRPKWGFRAPLDRWFRGPMRTFLTDYLLSGEGLTAEYGDRRRVERLLQAHLSEEVDASDALWTLLSAEVWFQDVFLPRMNRPAAPAVDIAAVV